MRLRSLIRRQVPTARLLVAVLLAVWSAPLVHALEDHDGAHGLWVEVHDCAEHDRSLSAAGESALPGVACAVCHFGRHVRSLADASGAGQTLFFPGARLTHAHTAPPPTAVVLPLPARAPPALQS
jgi:hypothetical protein